MAHINATHFRYFFFNLFILYVDEMQFKLLESKHPEGKMYSCTVS